MILYGHNNFLVKKVNPEEIGLNNSEFKGLTFELRQKYAHLYFIPIFPIGQEWFLRRHTGLFHVPPEIEIRLKTRFPSFLDWKAFALPILVILGISFYAISDKIKSSRYEEESKNQNTENIARLTNQIQNLNTYSYLVFNIDSQKNIYKVSNTAKDSVELIEYSYPLPNIVGIKEIVPYKTDLTYYQLSLAFEMYRSWVKKEDLIRTIKDEYNNKDVFIKSLNEEKPVKLVNIIAIDNAEFVINTSEEAKSVYYFEIQNYGLEVKIDTLISLANEKWDISKKRDVKLLEKFALKTENGTEATVFYTVKETQKKDSIKLKRSNGKLFFIEDENKENRYIFTNAY